MFDKPQDITIISGGAKGADSLAIEWAKARGVTYEVHPAQWDVHGKAAGPIRNQEMIDAGIDLLVAFPGGRGTAHMISRCKLANIEVYEVNEDLADIEGLVDREKQAGEVASSQLPI